VAIKGIAAQTTSVVRSGEGDDKILRLMRDGSVPTFDWKQSLALEGKVYLMQLGTEDAPIHATTSIDDQLVSGVIDVPDGAVAIPLFAQCVIALWSAADLLNFMIEVDNGKVRYSSGGTAWTPLNFHTGKADNSGCTCYVGADVTVAAKTSGGSLEVYRESIEVNVGDAADYWPKMEYIPVVCPVVEGPGSILYHIGSTNGDASFYGNIVWAALRKGEV